jgi:GntR family transcriptional repressor for pyruvate dehydrogenase complex
MRNHAGTEQIGPTTGPSKGAPMTTQRVQRGSVGAVDDIVNQLEAIALGVATTGALSEPTRIPSERALATSMGVARSTVREAVQRLVAKGVLETRRGHGIFVVPRVARDVSASWVKAPRRAHPSRSETFEFRLMFECTLARLAAERATPDELEQLRNLVDLMREAVSAGDTGNEAILDSQFHAALALASHNRILDHLFSDEFSLLTEHVTTNTHDASLKTADATSSAMLRLEQHQRILEAIGARAPDAAAEAMFQHLSFVKSQFL